MAFETLHYSVTQDHSRKRLRRCGFDPDSESSLLAALDESNGQWTILNALDVLAIRPPTEQCLPILKEVCTYRWLDAQCQALYMIEMVAGKHELPFYREMLARPAFRVKYPAVDALIRHGDQTDIDKLAGRARQLLARRAGRIWGDNRTELADILLFLERYQADSDAAARTIRWARGRLHILYEEVADNLLRVVPSMSAEASRPWILLVRPDLGNAGRLFHILFHECPAYGIRELIVQHRHAHTDTPRLVATSSFVIAMGPDAAALLKHDAPSLSPKRMCTLDLPAYVGQRYKTPHEFDAIAKAEEARSLHRIRQALTAAGLESCEPQIAS